MNKKPDIQQPLTPEGHNLDSQIPVLDGFRGLAVLLVMAYHFIDRFNFGWIGVDLFFVLSGFLISGKLFESVGKPGYYSKFFVRRILRIVPVYFLVLIVSFIVLPFLLPQATESVGPLVHSQWYYWTFTLNIYDAIHGWPQKIFLVHLWSIATEMQFYLIWPLVIVSFSKRQHLCGYFLLLFIIIAILFRVFDEKVFPLTAVSSYVMFPARMDAFCLGTLIYIFFRNGLQAKQIVYFILIAGIALLGMIGISSGMNFTWHHYNSVVEHFGFTLNAVFWSGLMGYALGKPHSILSRTLSIPFARTVGRYSYGMYIFHLPAGILLRNLVKDKPNFQGMGEGLQKFLVILLSFVITFILGMLSYHLFEKKFLRLKGRIRMGSTAT